MIKDQKSKVLVIAGDHAERVEIRIAFESLGHGVISTANGAEAIRMLDNMSLPKLIIISANLPLTPAEIVFTAIRANERFSKVPVMQILEAGQNALRDICYTLYTPISIFKLREALHSCLEPIALLKNESSMN